MLIKLHHPAKRINDVLSNRKNNDYLSCLLAIHRERKCVNKREQSYIVFRHDLFPKEELHFVTKFCKVTAEGPEVNLFQSDECIDSAAVVGEKIFLLLMIH